MEQFAADMALERELTQAKQAYESLKKHFPILPELDERELLTMGAKYPSLPLTESLWLWARDKLLSGDQPVADRIFKAVMEKSAVRDHPPIEGKGGSMPNVPPEPPKSFRAAHASVRDFIRSLSQGVTGV